MAAGSEPDRPTLPVPALQCLPPTLGVIMKTRLAAAPRLPARTWAAPEDRLTRPDGLASGERRFGLCRLFFASLALALMAGCSSSTPTATGPGASYQNAKDFFARGHSANYDHALDALAALSDADPPNDYTERARVLRTVILSGQFEGYRTLAEAYEKGAGKATDSEVKSDDTSLSRDTLRRAGEISLNFAEAAMQLTKGGQVPKGLTLDAPYPITLTSVSSATIDKIEKGDKTGPEEQQDASLGAPGLGVAKMLTAVVGGNADAVKSKMSAGPVPLDSARFGLFLANELADSASLFDRKHLYDPGKYKQLADIAQNAGLACAAALKESPDPETEKQLKKLQDQIKAGLKAAEAPAE